MQSQKDLTVIQETKESISRQIEATSDNEDVDDESCNEGIDDANDSRNLNMQASKLRLTRRVMSSKHISERDGAHNHLGISSLVGGISNNFR